MVLARARPGGGHLLAICFSDIADLDFEALVGAMEGRAKALSDVGIRGHPGVWPSKLSWPLLVERITSEHLLQTPFALSAYA